MPGKTIVRILFLAVGLTCGVSAGSAATLRGVIVDQSGAAVGYANLVLRADSQRDPFMKSRSSEDGRFVFERLPPGTYNIEVFAAAFVSRTVMGVRVPANQDVQIPPIKLEARELTCPQIGTPPVTYEQISWDATELRGQVFGFFELGEMATVSASKYGEASPHASTVTDSNKGFQFVGLKPGFYTLTVARPGYVPFVIDALEVRAGHRATIQGYLNIQSQCPVDTKCPPLKTIPMVVLCL